MKSSTKPKRGGKREGAGRPATVGATQRITLTLSPQDVAILKSIDKNLSAAVRALIARAQA